jgi:hypothetical protein
MRRSATLTLVLPLWLTACATVAPAPPKPIQAPAIPTLDKPDPAVLDPSFLERMQNFLQGRLPEQIVSAPPSDSASPNTKR